MPDVSRAVAHCFTGGEEELNAYLDLGLYIGITGWVCDERRGAILHDIVGRIPLERLLIETDSPDQHARGQRNEPANLRLVLDFLTARLGPSASNLAAVTEANARRLFGLDHTILRPG